MKSGSVFKNFIILLLLLLPGIIYAQQKKFQPGRPLYEVTFMPFSIVEPTHPQIRLGTDIYSGKNLSFGVELGYGFTALYHYTWGDRFLKYNYYQIRPNFKNYLSKSMKFRFYWGGELFYMFENNTAGQGSVPVYEFGEQIGTVEFSSAKYLRQKSGGNIFLGFKWYIRDWFIELYSGMGIFYKTVNVSNLQNAIYYPYDDNLTTFMSGDLAFIGFTGGLKIGWVLSREYSFKN